MSQQEEDASLKKYKEQLLKGMGNPFPNDPRKVIVKEFYVEYKGDKKMDKFDISKDTKNAPFKIPIKEGSEYKFGVGFYANHDIANGLKMRLSVKGKLVGAHNEDYLLGSFMPKKDQQVWMEKAWSEAPSGFTMRGTYVGVGEMYDRQGNKYHTWHFNFTITK
mmetsp:Transcript_8547/g.16806  ORF Transcript_8547/g.16806 Transcript_8547/m.16806 type:complete len:163 (-) Transcript_8547:101-589(-)